MSLLDLACKAASAAGHLLVKESGGWIRDLITGTEPKYNGETLRSNYLVAAGGHVRFEGLSFPDYGVSR